MRALILPVVFAVLHLSPAAFAEEAPPGPAELRVTVTDPTGAALVTATVTVTDAAGVPKQMTVNGSGVARFTGLVATSYHVTVEAEAFATSEGNLELKKGTNAIVVQLPLAGVKEDVIVQENTQDLKGQRLHELAVSEQEIAELPDDPDELEQVLMQMAGPGATMRVNGFTGGRLPPKSQIRQVRFRMNSYAADNHEAGGFGIDIITKPGTSNWRGRSNIGFRDESLNARNYFAPTLGPEQYRRFGFNADGPLVKGKTSIAFNLDGNRNYDSQTIVAAVAGRHRTCAARCGARTIRWTAACASITRSAPARRCRSTCRASNNTRSNLGVGDFDLPSRAYERDVSEAQLRTSLTGLIAPKVAHELKVQYRDTRTQTRIEERRPRGHRHRRVLDRRRGAERRPASCRELEVEDSIEFSPAKKHNMRAGLQLESFWVNEPRAPELQRHVHVREQRSRTTPGCRARIASASVSGLVDYTQWQAAWLRAGRLDDPKDVLAQPRPALRAAVAPRRHDGLRAPRRRDVDAREVHGARRLGHLQRLVRDEPLRADAARQRRHAAGRGRPEPGIPRSVRRRLRHRAAAEHHPRARRTWRCRGCTRRRSASSGTSAPCACRPTTSCSAGSTSSASVNINAPVNGVRPVPDAGNITELESTGQSDTDRWMLNVNYAKPERRLFLGANYQLARVYNFVDSPFSLPANNYDLAAEWGPSSRDTRHRLFSFLSFPLPKKLRGSLMTQAQSASPYTIITGIDNNRDTVLNDRPEGVGRNSARGSATWNMNARLSRSFSFGPPRQTDGGPGGGPIRVRGVGGPGGGPGGGGGGGGGGGPMMMMMDQGTGRYNVEFYAQALNVLNHTNFQNYAGSLRSPYFGEPTSAGPARRIEVGINFGF